ncbi:MAG: hypothetical protein KME08_01535 [Aphanothece sp. CMT-3BRIN-NPC111]|nr:hypothetical protein [Aphanothece sp. CMT-3BRIN-NPC111]
MIQAYNPKDLRQCGSPAFQPGDEHTTCADTPPTTFRMHAQAGELPEAGGSFA